MIFGYARISTKSQIGNNSFKEQEIEIKTKYPDVKMYYEQFTSVTTKRPILGDVLSKMQPNDILVVSKLDRLARTTVEGIELVKEMFERNLSVHILNVGLLENTPMGYFFLTILLAVAELERNQIVERTQTGRAIARLQSDYREGRPKLYSKKQIDHALVLKENHSYKQVEEMTGISKSTLIRAKKKIISGGIENHEI